MILTRLRSRATAQVLPEFILEKFKDIAIEDVVSKEGK